MAYKNIERKGGKCYRERKGEESSNIVAEIWSECVCVWGGEYCEKFGLEGILDWI